VISYAFNELAIKEIIACIDPENIRSIGMATRHGFEQAGRKAAYGTEFDLYRLSSTQHQLS
jgi:RimJ/RimL family protein N-acetyltransferase